MATSANRTTEQLTDAGDGVRDHLGLTVLDEQVCWDHLADEPLGRLAVQVDGSPHLVPVNHVVRNSEILFVSVAGTKLHRATHQPGAQVAFEVDGYDAATRTGWSVVVQGRIHPVDDLVEHTHQDVRGRPTWLEGYRDRQWLRIVPERVDGRRLGGGTDES